MKKILTIIFNYQYIFSHVQIISSERNMDNIKLKVSGGDDCEFAIFDFKMNFQNRN